MPKLDCLSNENIGNRFLDATNAFTDQFFKEALKPNPWTEIMRRSRIADIMEKYGCSEKKANLIYKKEHKEFLKEYNSPLAVAQRKIAELERRLEDIKEFINDPDYMDKHSDY